MKPPIFSLLGFLFLFFPTSLIQAQVDFKSGYYVNHSGDTISGLIAYPNGQKKYQLFKYKSNKGSTAQTFQVSDALAYGIGKERVFQQKSLSSDSEEEVVFMELILQGKVSLYQLNHSYYVQYLDKLKRIFIEENTIERDGELLREESTHHKRIMAEAFQACEDLRISVINGNRVVLPRQKVLIRLIEDFHNCSGEDYTNFKRIPWGQIKVGVQVGGEYSKIFLSTKNSLTYVEDVDFNVSDNLYASLTLEYSMPRLSERLSFLVEPGYRKNLFQGFNKSISEAQIITYRDFILKFDEVSVPFGFKYLLSPKLRNVYVAAGLTPEFYMNQDYLLREETENLVTQSVQYDEPELIILSDYQIGIWIRGGFSLLKTDRFNVPLQVSYQNIAGLIRSPFLFTAPPIKKVSFVRGVQHALILTCGIQF